MLERRVYNPEYEKILGISDTWRRVLESRGAISSGRADPGGRRKWRTESEVRADIERLKNQNGVAA